MTNDYKADLRAANEHHEYCFAHPECEAVVCDLDSDGRKVPVCEACWRARYPAIRQRLAEQRLILKGISMTTHTIPPSNWLTHLADAIEQAAEGDTIIVPSDDARELALRAIERMRPGAAITVEVRARDDDDD